MKKMYYTLSIVCLLLVFGCKKDKDDPKTQIIGKWKIEKTVLMVYINDKLSNDDSETRSTFTENDYYEFKSDGTITVNIDGKTNSAQYTLDDKNDKITLDGDEFSIKTLTKSKLVLGYDQTFTEGGEKTRLVVDINFKK